MEVLKLLSQAKHRGIRVSFADNELTVRFSKGAPADTLFLDELKSNRHHLISYFRNYDNAGFADWRKLAISSYRTGNDGKAYYTVSRYISYWVDDSNREYKEQLRAWMGYRISGVFDIRLFRMAVAYLAGRHESLRSAFPAVDGKYCMTAEVGPFFDVFDFRDLRGGCPNDEKDKESFFYFEGHTFDIRKGPLFLVRMIQTGDEDFLVALKLHHAIYDGWSLEVLIRDLLTAYLSFVKGGEPVLPPLSFQYKEWLHFSNYLMERDGVGQQQYWRALYDHLPEELLIPGARKRTGVLCRHGKKAFFGLDGEGLSRLRDLAGQQDTSLFIVLQASVLLYLFRLTGGRDILAGTVLFGRNGAAGIEDQIGCYAYTDLIRVVFDSDDNLDQAIRKVKRSNEDMNRYNVHTLFMAMSELYAPGEHVISPFWNLNLDFMDSSGRRVSRPLFRDFPMPDIQFDSLPDKTASTVTDMDLKIKFVDRDDKLEIRVHYDADLYDTTTIDHLMQGYLKYIDSHETK